MTVKGEAKNVTFNDSVAVDEKKEATTPQEDKRRKEI